MRADAGAAAREHLFGQRARAFEDDLRQAIVWVVLEADDAADGRRVHTSRLTLPGLIRCSTTLASTPPVALRDS